MATFWKESTLSPTRRRNFKVSLTISEKLGDVWFWAKTVSKPSIDVSVGEYQLINHTLKYPGLVTWNDITVTMVDTGSKTKELYELFKLGGYEFPDGDQKGLVKTIGGLNTHVLTIEQYGDKIDTPIEKWQCANAFIKSANFGELDYSSDDFVEIEVVFSYDWAELT